MEANQRLAAVVEAYRAWHHLHLIIFEDSERHLACLRRNLPVVDRDDGCVKEGLGTSQDLQCSTQENVYLLQRPTICGSRLLPICQARHTWKVYLQWRLHAGMITCASMQPQKAYPVSWLPRRDRCRQLSRRGASRPLALAPLKEVESAVWKSRRAVAEPWMNCAPLFLRLPPPPPT